MILLKGLIVLLLSISYADAKAVFAHFMVSNTGGYKTADWQTDIKAAQAAHIDAFAMNMGYGEATTTSQLPTAFSVAASLGFKLFFSFDYAGNGPWPKAEVIALINKYKGSAYYYRGSQPLVSTFEGPGQAADWTGIKSSTGCFFIPDWSSKGAMEAMKLGTADGLFSWDAWPKGGGPMNTYPDYSYNYYLKGKPYMMPVSPWFYTNMPGFGKNWLWKGDDLWLHRWNQILYYPYQPEFVQIISWNDFGESHYIGPLPSNTQAYEAFDRGKAPFDYVKGMPHNGWRAFLPYIIDLYKTGTATIKQEGISVWYRQHYKNYCNDGGTSANTASQFQYEYPPSEIVADKIYFTALLGSAASVSITIGGTALSPQWEVVPSGNIGLYHGIAYTNGYTGAVVIKLYRSSTGVSVTVPNTIPITKDCSATKGFNNWNAWVGHAFLPAAVSITPALNIAAMECVAGTGVYGFKDLCTFATKYGYVPDACVCTMKGAARTKPTWVDVKGYPVAGLDANYVGLCSFGCMYGYCPSNTCSTTKVTLTTSDISPFLPPVCREGTGRYADFNDICQFGCYYGYCPRSVCTCTATGSLRPFPAQTNYIGYSISKPSDAGANGLCQINGQFGHKSPACMQILYQRSTVSTDPDYKKHDCRDPLVSFDVLNPQDSTTRWDGLDTIGAWNNAITIWKGVRGNNGHANFSKVVSACYKYTEAFECEKVAEGNNCDTNAICSDFPAGPAAAPFIFNSMGAINEGMQNMLTAIDSVFGDSALIVTNVANEFAPMPESDQTARVLVDLITLGISLMMGPALQSQFKRLEFFLNRPELAGNIKDASLALIGTTGSLVKEKTQAAFALAIRDQLVGFAIGLKNAWRNSIEALNEKLFDGSDASIKALEKLMADGQLIGASSITPDIPALRDRFAKIVYAVLIPQALVLGGARTFIVSTGVKCDDPNPVKKYVSDSIAPKVKFCDERDGNMAYYFVQLEGQASTCVGTQGGMPFCSDHYDFSKVRNGDRDSWNATRWGGLSLDDIVLGSVEGWKAHDRKNNWKFDPTTLGDEARVQELIDLEVRTPGLMNIPVCSAEEAWDNWAGSSGGSSGDSWPCN